MGLQSFFESFAGHLRSHVGGDPGELHLPTRYILCNLLIRADGSHQIRELIHSHERQVMLRDESCHVDLTFCSLLREVSILLRNRVRTA